MKELSLNILDITENSLKAGATLVSILIEEKGERLTVSVEDNGSGMTGEVLGSVENPFYTTRTTRKVGMGIPLFRFAAEQTGGSLKITSRHISEYPDSHGTVVSALFNKEHIDFTPLGNTVETVLTLIQGHPDVDFTFIHRAEGGDVSLDTREIREVLEEVPLNSFEVLEWIRENLCEQYELVKQKK